MLHASEELGEIVAVAVRHRADQPRVKLYRIQHKLSADDFHVFKNIAGTIPGIKKFERYKGTHDADIVITFEDDIDARGATVRSDELLTRTCRYLARRKSQQIALSRGDRGFAVTSEVILNDFMGR